jgi:hypothetical protein
VLLCECVFVCDFSQLDQTHTHSKGLPEGGSTIIRRLLYIFESRWENMAYTPQGVTPIALTSGSPSFIPNNLTSHGEYLVRAET